MARTITNPANGSPLSSAVIRNELQILENEIAVTQPLATVLTNTTASYTTAIDTRLANTSGTNTGDQTLLGLGGANTALSNLAAVAINTSLVSDTDNTDDLGTTVKKWANLFITTIGATATRVVKGWFTNLEITNLPTVNGGTLASALSLSGTNTGDQTPTSLGLVIGTNVQAYNANLTAINQALTITSSPSFTTVTAALSGNATTSTNTTGNAATVTTNANLTGVVTSTGNATAIADAALSIAKTSGLQSALDLKAPLASPALTGTPTAPTASAGDSTTLIATTAFVQQAVRSVPSKEASKYATIAALPAIVYYNGVANDGVGATLTGVAVGALGVDSASPSVGDRVLVKNQVSTFQNGIYTVTATGSGIAVFVLTRALDFNQSVDIKTGATTYVTSGTTLAATTWDVNSADSPVMGTDAITFIQSAGPGSIIAGTGISITGVTVAVDSTIATLTGTQTLTNKTLTSPTLTTPALGTPSSGVMTNVTGTAAGLTAGLATSLTGGSGGTIPYQSSAGVTAMLANGTAGQILSSQGTTLAPQWIANSVAISTGVTGLGTGVATALAVNVGTTGAFVTDTSTNTLTNKRITKRVLALSANSATPAINTDLYDVVHITAQTAAITSFTTNLTGTPVDGDTLRISVTGTAAVALTFGASFEASTVALSTTTVTTARLDMGFFWNTETSKWRQVAQS